MQLLLLAAFFAIASARPSFIAVPADQRWDYDGGEIAFVDLSRIHRTHAHVRVPRQALSPPPAPPQLPQGLYTQDYLPIPLYQQPLGLAPQPEPVNPTRVLTLQQQPRDVAPAASLAPSARLAERPPDFGEFVDFGAHTGDNGAFGWYADYPINNHDDSSSSSFRK